jgi:hypothetical protein
VIEQTNHGSTYLLDLMGLHNNVEASEFRQFAA